MAFACGKVYAKRCVAALVDRFTENCHVIDIEADSWRQKNGGAGSRG